MAPVNGASNKPAKGPTNLPIIVPAIPFKYIKKKEKEAKYQKPPQPNGSLDIDRDVKPSLTEDAPTPSSQPAPVESASAIGPGPSAPVASSSASADSQTVVAAPNGPPNGHPNGHANGHANDHPNGRPFAFPGPSRRDAPTVSISSPPILNGPVHQLSPVDWQKYKATHPFPFHHPHPSNESLIQSGFQGSTASSPIPPSNGGFPPPNRVAYHDGYVPPAIFPAAMGSHHGPLTSHSFHGSQSSRLAEDLNGGPGPAMNGHAAYPVQNGHAPVRADGPMAASNAIKLNLQHEADTLVYVRSGAETPLFNDCVLELRFPENNMFEDHPDCHRLQKVVQMPAHRFILARSGTLREALQKEQIAPGGVLIFHLRDKYMRSDVVCAAIRTMYGWPMGDGLPYTDLRLRNRRDEMMLMLSYIAAGQDLQLPWVFGYATQRASGMLDWDTIDLVVDFVLPSVVLPRHSASPFGLGPFMNYVLGFIIHYFPQDFVLDVTVGDGGFTRLPPAGSLGGADTPAASNASSHPSATGSYMPNGPRSSNPGLQKIRFGDLSAAEQSGRGSTGAPDATGQHRAPTVVDTVLSRILLNLPYELLKEVLEAPNLGGSPMALGGFARQAPVAEIIAEREARRIRALNMSDPDLTEALEKARTPLVVNGQRDFYINAMGFREEVCLGDLPFLVHTWTKSSPPGSETA